MAKIVIVTPALADANNGNWQTAARWRRMLGARHDVRIVQEWSGGPRGADDAMIALHAHKSLASITAWSRTHPGRGLAVVLTGTDLYGDPSRCAVAFAAAQRLVVLQHLGVRSLPIALRGKARVIVQSTTRRATLLKSERRLRAVAAGHLRAVKSPETVFAAARLLANRRDIFIDHVGQATQARYAALARATEARCPGYRWLGGQPHEATRRRIQRAHVLVHASLAEGGAHVIMEAVCSGTPVLASRIDGNVGMLGADYGGYFPAGDPAALARLLARARDDRRWLAALRRQCAARAPTFAPARERRSLLALAGELTG